MNEIAVAAPSKSKRRRTVFFTQVRPIVRALPRQLTFMPLGRWFWPALVAIGVIWSVLIANQVQAVTSTPQTVQSILIRLIAELQAIPALIGVVVVLCDDFGRSRRTTALAMPWPGTLFVIRWFVTGLLGGLWALSVNLIGTVLLGLGVGLPSTDNPIALANAYMLMPLYAALLGLTVGAAAQLINRLVPALIFAVAGIGVLIPLLGIFVHPVRFLPGVIGLPPAITTAGDLIPPQSIGLPLLALWGLSLACLALYVTSRRDI